MQRQTFFKSGRHIAASRTMAGLKQTELAALARLHVNSLKRLEAMKALPEVNMLPIALVRL